MTYEAAKLHEAANSANKFVADLQATQISLKDNKGLSTDLLGLILKADILRLSLRQLALKEELKQN